MSASRGLKRLGLKKFLVGLDRCRPSGAEVIPINRQRQLEGGHANLYPNNARIRTCGRFRSAGGVWLAPSVKDWLILTLVIRTAQHKGVLRPHDPGEPVAAGVSKGRMQPRIAQALASGHSGRFALANSKSIGRVSRAQGGNRHGCADALIRALRTPSSRHSGPSAMIAILTSKDCPRSCLARPPVSAVNRKATSSSPIWGAKRFHSEPSLPFG